MLSDKQQQANKNNALLGGVKSSEGKAVSKYNAQTHGILRLSLTDYESEIYPDILSDLNEQYEPQNIIEKLLIERIALCYIKLFRVQKAETEFMKAQLNPHIEVEKLTWNTTEVTNEGYTPIVGVEGVERLLATYSRYETTIENRLFRALHELERAQKLRRGENVVQALAVDFNSVGSFGETNKL